jgi:hypothetical protein
MNSTAANIAAAIITFAPFVLPLLLKYVPWIKTQMLVFTYAVSVGVVVIAAALAGLLTTSSFASVPAVLAIGTAMFGAVQLVYGLLKNSGQFKLVGRTIQPAKFVV